MNSLEQLIETLRKTGN